MVRVVAQEILPIDVSNLKKLVRDEISAVKEPAKFILVLVDLSTHKLVGWVWSRTQSEIEKVMGKGGEKVLSQIEEVSMDMTGKYKSLVRKLCPNAEVTVDIFPIIKIVNSQLNQAIIDPKKTALSLNIKEKYQVFCSLKESKYTLLKAEHKLSNKKNIKNQ